MEGAHKSEEAAERGLKYGARKIKQGYRSHKLKPYREAAKAEKSGLFGQMWIFSITRPCMRTAAYL